MCILCIIHRATYQIKNVVVVAFINCIIKSREMKNLRKKYDYMNLFKQYVGFFLNVALHCIIKKRQADSDNEFRNVIFFKHSFS